jgi:hypothetical protein
VAHDIMWVFLVSPRSSTTQTFRCCFKPQTARPGGWSISGDRSMVDGALSMCGSQKTPRVLRHSRVRDSSDASSDHARLRGHPFTKNGRLCRFDSLTLAA